MSIAELLDESKRSGRIFNFCAMGLIVFGMLLYCVESYGPSLSPRVERTVDTLTYVVIVLFTVEYVLRLIAARDKREYIFSYSGMVDLASILPFYLSAGAIDSAPARALRLLLIFRLFRLMRFNLAIKDFARAFESIREELVLLLLVVAIMIFLSAVGIHYFESEAQPDKFQSIFHCMWWSVATLTTVGYGDMYPVTVGGKIFTAFVTIAGVGTIAVPSGLIASALMRLPSQRRTLSRRPSRAHGHRRRRWSPRGRTRPN
ncbi:ion transporter [Kolteria novifilia]|uniref:ion transporter n=1 Tax=Kolteria novifilia TaxID=2527975 RepID=UPI003AF3D2E9